MSTLIDENKIIAEVIKLAGSCHYEEEHSHQVTRLALKLFDELKKLHRLRPRHRLLLQSASLLHDIGWVKGGVRHHKTARDIIVKSSRIPLSTEERIVVALVARYHRRALPKDTHKYYRDLDERGKEEVRKLASLLRIADGLDRARLNSVKDLKCLIFPRKIVVQIRSDHFVEYDRLAARKKADLFGKTFKKDLLVQSNWSTGHEKEDKK